MFLPFSSNCFSFDFLYGFFSYNYFSSFFCFRSPVLDNSSNLDVYLYKYSKVLLLVKETEPEQHAQRPSIFLRKDYPCPGYPGVFIPKLIPVSIKPR